MDSSVVLIIGGCDVEKMPKIPLHMYICSERYAQRPVGPTGRGVHRPGR